MPENKKIVGFTSTPHGTGAAITSVLGKSIPQGILYSVTPAPKEARGVSQRSLDALDSLIKRSVESRTR